MNTNFIFDIKTNDDFENAALKIFHHQHQNNKVYQLFCQLLKVDVNKVNAITKIPFLPIAFFKTHAILSSIQPVQEIFSSSGTTGSITSKHMVTDVAVYEKSFRQGFAHFYGNIEDYAVLALLPSYLERTGSSLIYMVNDFIQQSKNPHSGFYLHNLEELKNKLITLDASGQKVLLIGVSFALLDLVALYRFNLKNTIIMETGGMKGKRKEMIRNELHAILAKGFGVKHIHSEYGMTELLAQGYSKGNGIFEPSPWMKILTRDTEDPLTMQPFGKTGGINIIDLANIHSCSFIATQDLGKVYKNGTFEVIGRFDNSDIRGCNLMVL